MHASLSKRAMSPATGYRSVYRSARTGITSALLSLAMVLSADAQGPFRSINGSNNNPLHPAWGKAHIELLRKTTVGYADGVATPSGPNRPSARAVSNRVCSQQGSLPSAGLTDFFWQWGQFLDHDIDITEAAVPAEPFPIPVPSGDPFFDPMATGTATIPLDRSRYSIPDGTSVRQQVNDITAFIDGSVVYGSDRVRARELRRRDGRLKTSAGNLLPFNVHGLPNAPTSEDPSLFLAGDVRANEQVGLTAMHTLFVREHNRIVGMLRSQGVGPEMSYELARMLVGAEIQAITYNEFLAGVAARADARCDAVRGATIETVKSEHRQRVLDGGLSFRPLDAFVRAAAAQRRTARRRSRPARFPCRTAFFSCRGRLPITGSSSILMGALDAGDLPATRQRW